jgi:hypothetical protein
VRDSTGLEVEELLYIAFSDWFDFLFVPIPEPFVIYADPGEYATFYANTRFNLNPVVEALSGGGIAESFRMSATPLARASANCYDIAIAFTDRR